MSRDNQLPMPAPTGIVMELESSQESTTIWDNDRILHIKHSTTVGGSFPVLIMTVTLTNLTESLSALKI
jgi:hypothetical protein